MLLFFRTLSLLVLSLSRSYSVALLLCRSLTLSRSYSSALSNYRLLNITTDNELPNVVYLAKYVPKKVAYVTDSKALIKLKTWQKKEVIGTSWGVLNICVIIIAQLHVIDIVG